MPPARLAPTFKDIEDIRRAVSSDFIRACQTLYWLNPRSNIDPETGLPTGKEGLIRFQLYPEQRIQAQAQLEMQRKNKPVRVIKLKCRQSGDSTFAACWTFHGMYWRPRRRALVVTHHESTTNALYMMYQTFYNELPDELKWTQRRFNRKELSFEPPSGSSLVAQTAGFLDIGHGLTLQDVHLSEIDRWPDPETALEGIMETTPIAPGTSIIIESVSDGADGWLHNFWRASKEGKTDFLPLFTPVHKIPEYRLPVPSDFEPTAEEQEWVQEFGVKAAFLMWYRSKKNEFIARYPWGGERRLKAMYPFTDEQAFQSSGFCVFPDNVLQRMRTTVRTPEPCVEPIPLGPGQFRAQRADWGEDNALGLWEQPNPNYAYSIGLDIADGVGATESVASVWRYPGYEQVGEWGSKHSSLEHTAWVANWIAELFGKCGARVLMVPEINKSGPLILYILNQITNPVFDMYRWQYLDKFAPYASDNPKLGWECLAPWSRVLMEDLSWQMAESVKVGDRVIGFSESIGKRLRKRLRIQTVTDARSFMASTYEVVLDDGRTTVVSSNHPFWMWRTTEPQWRWMSARRLRLGDTLIGLPVWDTLKTYEAGRLSAFLDGEGHISEGRRWGLTMLTSQLPGTVADDIADLWVACGFPDRERYIKHERARPRANLIEACGVRNTSDVVRALGSLRPLRLLEKFRERMDWDKVSIQGFNRGTVVALRPLGEGPVIGLTTSPDHTLIADGIVGHNTNDVTKTMLPQAFNKIFMSGAGSVRSAILLEQMGRCVDVLPSRRWRVAGKGSDRVLAALIGIMGAYVEFEGGKLDQGQESTRVVTEDGGPLKNPAICSQCFARFEWRGPEAGGDFSRCPKCRGQVRPLQRGQYDAEFDDVFSGMPRGGPMPNYVSGDWDV